jgi:hypothetical protein
MFGKMAGYGFASNPPYELRWCNLSEPLMKENFRVTKA